MSLEARGVFYFEPTPEYTPQLLNVFQFSTWGEQTDEFKASLSPALRRKLKQLSLISMAMDSKQITYQKASTQLEIPLEFLELFLVEALLDKAIEGKVNATSQTLYINSCATRNCSPQQVINAQEMLSSFLFRLEGAINSNMARLKENPRKKTHTQKEVGE